MGANYTSYLASSYLHRKERDHIDHHSERLRVPSSVQGVERVLNDLIFLAKDLSSCKVNALTGQSWVQEVIFRNNGSCGRSCF